MREFGSLALRLPVFVLAGSSTTVCVVCFVARSMIGGVSSVDQAVAPRCEVVSLPRLFVVRNFVSWHVLVYKTLANL